MGAQAALISHSACEEIKIEASRVINRPQCASLQGAFGECVRRMASGFDCPGPSNCFIDAVSLCLASLAGGRWLQFGGALAIISLILTVSFVAANQISS